MGCFDESVLDGKLLDKSCWERAYARDEAWWIKSNRTLEALGQHEQTLHYSL